MNHTVNTLTPFSRVSMEIAARLAVRTWILVFCALSMTARADLAAKNTDDVSLKLGAFVDTYYDYDFDNPTTLDRAYTTTAARHNEFNINMAYIDVTMSGERVRGRMALQTGTSVSVNYAEDGNGLGFINGPGNPKRPPFLENIQEAYLGYRVMDRLWIDAGIMFSYLGFENFISKNNWTYTRSLGSDFSPYFETGVRAAYKFSDQVAAQLNIMNGWDNIFATTESKAIGAQIAFTPNSVYSITYNNFWGDQPGQLSRFFNDFIFTFNPSAKVKIAVSYDVGIQAQASGSGNSVWQNCTLLTQYRFSPTFAMAFRGEYYQDPNQVIVYTGTPNGFQTGGVSIGDDLVLAKALLWRNEIRALWSLNSVFPGEFNPLTQDSVIVTSLALAL